IIDWADGRFYLAGIDDAFYGVAKPADAFREQPENTCTIVLSHAPCVVNRLDAYRADLVLAGHTHGGQVRLPYLGALRTPPGSGKYECGLYQLEAMKLYVNRGIGTSILPVRFLCPPEITHFTLRRVRKSQS
ncbi:MAG: metallophosphoesterase, partial [Alphaproteobacteria bacterium]